MAPTVEKIYTTCIMVNILHISRKNKKNNKYITYLSVLNI